MLGKSKCWDKINTGMLELRPRLNPPMADRKAVINGVKMLALVELPRVPSAGATGQAEGSGSTG